MEVRTPFRSKTRLSNLNELLKAHNLLFRDLIEPRSHTNSQGIEMNFKSGVQRIKILWAAICFIPAIVIAAILSFSQYRPDLMIQFSILSLFIASSLSLPFFFDISLKTRLFFAIVGGGGGAAIFFNLDKAQDAIYGEYKPAAFALIGVALWLAWAAVEWVVKGFLKKE